jgi:hypothetical protein
VAENHDALLGGLGLLGQEVDVAAAGSIAFGGTLPKSLPKVARTSGLAMSSGGVKNGGSPTRKNTFGKSTA